MSTPPTNTWDPTAYRGSRFKNSRHGQCPHCGQPLTHGLRGDPTRRNVPPCLRGRAN